MKKLLLAALISSSMATSAFAATPGDLGATSTGTFQATLDLAALVKVSGLDDVILQNNTSAGGFVASTNFCVYTNNGVGDYGMTISGDGARNTGFSLADGANQVDYSVNYAPSRITTPVPAGTVVDAGVEFTGTGGANTDGALNCTNGATDDNATLWVKVPDSEIAGAPQGNYVGTLTVLVTAK